MIRYVWVSLGLLCVFLGVVGLFLPFLPTAPFLLAAAFFFSRSSKRLHDWLLNHDHLGPPIRDWQEKRAISFRSKVLASISILLAGAVSPVVGIPMNIVLIQWVILLPVTVFIWTRPSA